jgi:hypothetical protein
MLDSSKDNRQNGVSKYMVNKTHALEKRQGWEKHFLKKGTETVCL